MVPHYDADALVAASEAHQSLDQYDVKPVRRVRDMFWCDNEEVMEAVGLLEIGEPSYREAMIKKQGLLKVPCVRKRSFRKKVTPHTAETMNTLALRACSCCTQKSSLWLSEYYGDLWLRNLESGFKIMNLDTIHETEVEIFFGTLGTFYTKIGHHVFVGAVYTHIFEHTKNLKSTRDSLYRSKAASTLDFHDKKAANLFKDRMPEPCELSSVTLRKLPTEIPEPRMIVLPEVDILGRFDRNIGYNFWHDVKDVPAWMRIYRR